MPRPSKRKLAGRSNRIKRARISVERELEAQALLQSEEPGPHRRFTVSSIQLSITGAKLSGIPESTVTAVLKDYVKLFLKL